MSTLTNAAADVERCIIAMRNVFAVAGDPAKDDIARLHATFVAAVDDANFRLRHCDDLLRRGLRQEALQECEQEPNLLDLVTQLDIPEWDAWADYVVQLGLPPQPPLLIDVAGELNDAYSAAQSLDGLLRTHRLHALARSPLPVRLGILRTIGARDPKNPAWKEDLNSYESARLKEIRPEFQSHLERGDVRGVMRIRQELEGLPWATPPQPALLDEVRSGHQRLVAADALTKLKALEPTINDAFAAFEFPALMEARHSWDQLWPLANLPANHELASRVAPAFEWLDEETASQQRQSQYERDVASLEAALDKDKAQLSNLKRLYAAIERYDEPIPQRLQRRYEERVRSLHLAEHRRGRFRLASSVAAIALLGIIVAFLIFRQIRAGEVAAAVDALGQLMANKQVDQARQYYDELAKDKPHITEDATIRAVYADLQGQLARESQRVQRFDAMLRQVEQLDESATWNALSDAQRTLRDAKALAFGDAEQLRVLEAERDVNVIAASLQASVDEEFRSAVADFTTSLTVTPPVTGVEVSQALQQAEALRQTPRVSAEARSASGIDIAIAKLKSQRQALADEEDRRIALERILRSVGDASAYRTALERYVSIAPNAPRSSDFQDILRDDLGLLAKLTTWNDQAAKWNACKLQSSQDAETAIAVLGALLQDFEEFPSVREVLQLRPYAESVIARRVDGGVDLRASLREILKDDLFNMNRIQAPNAEGYIYFFGEPRRVREGVIEIDRLLDSRDYNKTDTRQLSGSPGAASLSPQKKFAKDANEWLTNETWTFERAACAVLDRLYTDGELDPILKCWLIKIFYEHAAPGSSIFAEELSSLAKRIESNYALEDQNFLDAKDAQIEKIRANAQTLLDRVLESETPKMAYTKRIAPRVAAATNGAIRLPKLTWIGILIKGSGGAWDVRLADGANRSQVGQMGLVYQDSDGKARLKTIGEMTQSGAILDTGASNFFREGRPVFLLSID